MARQLVGNTWPIKSNAAKNVGRSRVFPTRIISIREIVRIREELFFERESLEKMEFPFKEIAREVTVWKVWKMKFSFKEVVEVCSDFVQKIKCVFQFRLFF